MGARSRLPSTASAAPSAAAPWSCSAPAADSSSSASASGEPTELSAGDLLARGITATAAIGARIAQRPGGLRDLEEQALAAAADGRLVPVVQRFALAQAAAAHEAIEGRATVGKTVLVP